MVNAFQPKILDKPNHQPSTNKEHVVYASLKWSAPTVPLSQKLLEEEMETEVAAHGLLPSRSHTTALQVNNEERRRRVETGKNAGGGWGACDKIKTNPWGHTGVLKHGVSLWELKKEKKTNLTGSKATKPVNYVKKAPLKNGVRLSQTHYLFCQNNADIKYQCNQKPWCCHTERVEREGWSWRNL